MKSRRLLEVLYSKQDKKIAQSQRHLRSFSGELFGELGICGQPDWLQDAQIPKCPKNGNTMRFLCQLGSFSGIEATFCNVNPTEGMEEYFQKLNFWCDGNLYIFIEPTSKTMCYTMQNT